MTTNVEAVRDKPITPPSNGRQKPIIQPQKTPLPSQNNDAVDPQVGVPVPTKSANVKEASEYSTADATTPTLDPSDYPVGEAIKKTKTRIKDNFIKLKNYDDDNFSNESIDEEEMIEIDVNETEDITPKPKKTITRKIKSKFKEVTNENSLLGFLLQNGTFMTAMKAGSAGFGTLFSICMMFVILKLIKTI